MPISIFKFLLDCGVDVNAKDKQGRSALMHACKSGFPQPAELLLERGADIDSVDNVIQTIRLFFIIFLVLI